MQAVFLQPQSTHGALGLGWLNINKVNVQTGDYVQCKNVK